jgi:hypothetical protein
MLSNSFHVLHWPLALEAIKQNRIPDDFPRVILQNKGLSIDPFRWRTTTRFSSRQ